MWGGANARHRVEPDYWMTLTGANNADFNLVLCHGASLSSLDECLDQVKEFGAPTKLMLCGASLGNARRLMDEGWICVRALPFMAAQLQPGFIDPGVRRLARADLPAFRSIFESAYRSSPETTALAIPDCTASEVDGSDSDIAAWGLYVDESIVAGTVTVEVGANLCVFSMATPHDQQRRGYGGRLLRTLLSRGAADGLEQSLLNSTVAGESLYRATGYCVVEYWQIWSRPRWVLV
jgi:hypothetical protein